jgi:uncharacterized protein (TIGR03067 family)
MRPRTWPALAALLAVAAASSAFPPLPPAKAKKPAFDLKALEGAWKVVRCEVGGPRGGDRTVGNETVHIQRGKWVAVTVFRDGSTLKSVAYTLSLDATRSPAALDMTFRARDEGGNWYGHTRKGVALLKGDRLTVVHTLGKERPAGVDGALAKSQERWVLERKKP